MCLSGLTVHHPAYETLKIYAMEGLPVNTGRNWTKEEINTVVKRGPQEDQGPQTYWSTHERKFKFPTELPPPEKN